MSQFPFAGQTPAPFQQAPQFAPAPAPQYAAPQFPGVPAAPNPYGQPFPTPPAYPQPAPYGQQFGQPFYPQAQPQAPAQPLPQGSLEAFYGQPKTGRPQAVSWKGMPDGTTVAGVVAEDVTDKDVVPDTDPQTHQLKTFRDGSPKYALAVTLRVQPSQANPEGLVTLYCRGDLWDKMAAAMEASGRHGAPKAGDVIYVSLVERRQGRGSVPRNIFAVQYQANATAAAPAPQAAPVAPTPQAEVPAPVAPQYAPPAAPQLPGMPQFPATAPAAPQFQAPAAPQLPQGAYPGAVQQAPAAPQPPAGPQQGLPGMPDQAALAASLTPEQQALLAALRGQA